MSQRERAYEILRSSRTIAVLGAHEQPARPAFYVPEYLRSVGYRVIPVNPTLHGELWGEPIRATLAEIDEPVDIVDVFRRPSAIPDHVDDILAMSPRPKVVWLQLGIRSAPAAERLEAEGIEVIQDRCTLADHRRMAASGG